MMTKNSPKSENAKKFRNAEKNIFERKDANVFVQFLGAIFGLGKQ